MFRSQPATPSHKPMIHRNIDECNNEYLNVFIFFAFKNPFIYVIFDSVRLLDYKAKLCFYQKAVEKCKLRSYFVNQRTCNSIVITE